MIGNHVYPQGYRGFESLSLRYGFAALRLRGGWGSWSGPAPARRAGSGRRIPLSPPRKQAGSMGSPSAQGAGIEALVCRSVCTPLDEATIQAAIDRLTVALTMAHDDEIPALVTERCALRDELSA